MVVFVFLFCFVFWPFSRQSNGGMINLMESKCTPFLLALIWTWFCDCMCVREISGVFLVQGIRVWFYLINPESQSRGLILLCLMLSAVCYFNVYSDWLFLVFSNYIV